MNPGPVHVSVLPSDSHVHLDLLVRLVTLQHEVLHGEVLYAVDGAGEAQSREGSRLALQLLLERLHVVQIDMRVSRGVHELPRLVKRTQNTR